MSKLKKTAVVSAVIFALSTVGAVAVSPFAVSSGVEVYNGLVTEAMENPDAYTQVKTLSSQVTEVSLQAVDWVNVFVEKSPDQQIHITTYDGGFIKTEAQVTENGSRAEVALVRKNAPIINEENVKKSIHAEVNNNPTYAMVLQLPETASLFVEDEELWGLHLYLTYSGFANGREVMKQLNRHDAADMETTEEIFDDYGWEDPVSVSHNIGELRFEIGDLRRSLMAHAEDDYEPAEFLEYYGQQYINLANSRILLAKACQLQREYDSGALEPYSIFDLNEVEVPGSVMENIRELSRAEQEADLLTVKLAKAYEDLTDGDLSEEMYNQLSAQYTAEKAALEAERAAMEQAFNAYCDEGAVSTQTTETQEAIKANEPEIPAEVPIN